MNFNKNLYRGKIWVKLKSLQILSLQGSLLSKSTNTEKNLKKL